MTTKRLCSLTALLLISAGCASNLSSELDAFSNALDANTPLSQVSYVPIETSGSKSFKISRQSSVVELPAGKSYSAGFKLPAALPESIEVRSYLSGGMMMKDVYLFRPAVTFLDRDFSPTRTFVFDRSQLRTDAWRMSGNSMYADLVVKPEKGERYLVVHTPEESLGQTFQSVHYDLAHSLPYSPVGTLKLIAK